MNPAGNEISHYLAGGLHKEQIDSIHQTALRVIEEIGVEVSHPRLLQLLSGHNGVHIDKTRVKIDSSLVNKYVQEYHLGREKDEERSDDWVINTPGALPIRIVDLDTGKIRPFLTEDGIEMTKLVDSLYSSGVRGSVSGLPQDVPPPLREIISCKIASEYSRNPAGIGFTSSKIAGYVREMYQVLGKPFGIPMFVISPLRIEGNEVETLMDYLQEIQDRQISVGVTNIPMVGATAPIFLVGAFVQSIAAVLAGFTILKIIAPEADINFNIRVYPFDMKYGGIAMGTPQEILMDLISGQIMEYYTGVKRRISISFHTNAVEPDMQATSQRAAFTMVAALNGARSFGYGGLLAVDKVFSAEQLLTDIEILNYAKEFIRGFKFSEEYLALDVLKEVGPKGTFLTHQTTLNNYRRLLWNPEIFSNMSVESWEESGRENVRDRARKIIKQKIADHDFELNSNTRKELNKIYERAKDDLLS